MKSYTLKERISDLSDTELISILNEKSQEYRDEAIIIVKEEIAKRQLSGELFEKASDDIVKSDKGKLPKILLGVATVYPFLYICFFFVYIFMSFFSEMGSGYNRGFPISFSMFFIINLLTMIISLVLLVIYVINIYRNERVDKDKKVLWTILVFMGGPLAMPVYWYLYIWKNHQT